MAFVLFKLALALHHDANVTNSYEGRESSYPDPVVWNGLSKWPSAIVRVDNTQAGRIVSEWVVHIAGGLVSSLTAYGEVFRCYFLHSNDPCVHTLWRGDQD